MHFNEYIFMNTFEYQSAFSLNRSPFKINCYGGTVITLLK